ncbi:MAG TPA: hypothetical protein VEA59_06545, partial [Patescibacteria group bacterium]|nr:hypothetical protein [Patescibacteria group bacterium]
LHKWSNHSCRRFLLHQPLPRRAARASEQTSRMPLTTATSWNTERSSSAARGVRPTSPSEIPRIPREITHAARQIQNSVLFFKKTPFLSRFFSGS